MTARLVVAVDQEKMLNDVSVARERLLEMRAFVGTVVMNARCMQRPCDDELWSALLEAFAEFTIAADDASARLSGPADWYTETATATESEVRE